MLKVVVLVMAAAVVGAGSAHARPEHAPPVALVAEALGVDLSPGPVLDKKGRAVARAAGHRLLSLCPDCRLSTIAEEGPCGWARSNRLLIKKAVAAGMTEEAIVETYVKTYGPEVLAIDTNQGWAATSWMLPFSLILASLVALLVLGRRMTLRPTRANAAPARAAPPVTDDRAAAAVLRAELNELD